MFDGSVRIQFKTERSILTEEFQIKRGQYKAWKSQDRRKKVIRFLCVFVLLFYFCTEKYNLVSLALSNLTIPNINQLINLVFDIKQPMIWQVFARFSTKILYTANSFDSWDEILNANFTMGKY